jgi:hypothetical protein
MNGESVRANLTSWANVPRRDSFCEAMSCIKAGLVEIYRRGTFALGLETQISGWMDTRVESE